VVVTSDNGCPFPRVKGQMYEDDLRLPLAARWPEMTSGGRVVEDMVSFIDFAPTFLEAAGYKVPDSLPGQSLFDIFKASGSGVAAGRRQRVFMGRERHDLGREGDKGYPVRCLRTPRHLYVRNYAPDRWPAGNPETGFTNCDSSPVKETILALRERGDGVCYALCFGKRPAEELYDIREDPHCMANLAEKREYAQMRDSLRTELEAELEITGDPRARGEGDIFDSYEYVAAPEESLHSWANSLAGTWQPQRY
jgi:N-sulfoglucosamine sulfohydrolase